MVYIIGVIAYWGAYTNTDVIKVYCNSHEERLLDCPNTRSTKRRYNCRFGGGAEVRCRDEQLQIKNVSATKVTTDALVQTVLVSWELYSGALHNPSSFRVHCFSHDQQHCLQLFVNNGTLTWINIGISFLLVPPMSAVCRSFIMEVMKLKVGALQVKFYRLIYSPPVLQWI